MTETLPSLIFHAKHSKYSQLLTLSEDGLGNVWKHVSDFIRKQLCSRKGAGIAGFGTFTFSQQLESGGSKVSRPIFVLSEKLAQLHVLKMKKQHTSGHIPVVPLNFTVISNEVALKREVVESAVKEVILALSHSLAAKKNIEFELDGIGKLVIVDKKVQMKFYKEFVSSLDSSGEMGRIFQRCNTASSELSIMSGPGIQSFTKDQRFNPLPCINEDTSNCSSELQIKPLASTIPKTQSESKVIVTETTYEIDTEKKEPHQMEPLYTEEKPSLQEERAKTVHLGISPTRMSRQNSRQSLCVPTASGVFYNSPECLVEGPGAPLSNQNARKTSTTVGNSPPASAQSGLQAAPFVELPPLSPALPTGKRRSRSISPSKNSTPMGCNSSLQQRTKTEPGSMRASPSCHDLCYICHQRAQRNIPVSFVNEVREREMKETAMWQEYEKKQREQHEMKEQAARMTNIKYAKDNAAFNYEVSMTKEVQRKKQSNEFHPSYVFQYRTLTPPKEPLQQKYCSELDNQVAISRHREKERKELESSMDKEYQQQLAKQLALSKEEFQREKAEQKALYQAALAEQIQWKQFIEPQQPAVQPVFGVSEPAAKHPANKNKEIARQLFLEQNAMAAEMKRSKEEKALKIKEFEAEMLTSTMKELLEDREEARRTKQAVRKKLEMIWDESVKEKEKRTVEEQKLNKGSGILLLDQCLRHKRCKQCQRRLDNAGNLRLGVTV